MGNSLEQTIEKILKDYVGTVTHTSTALENNNQVFFERYFSGIEYFAAHPEHWGFHPIKNDPLNRKVPWGLLKGKGSDTIVLIHHSDTVDADDYGSLKSLAHHPFELTRQYANGAADLHEEARRDLASGEWLFGRGVADMKGGASIHLALLEEYSKDKDFSGNLLLLGLPDEENLSAGMRGAISLLTELKEAHHLNYILLLNVEPQERAEEDLMRLYDGSVGKLMPIFYVRGKLAHVAQVFQGLNPIHILSEIVAATELNPGFSEQVGNSKTPPPTWLFLKDRKEVYDVSLPLSAAGYMNVLTLGRPAMDIMEQLKKLSREAFDRVIRRSNESYRRYTGDETACLPWQSNVKTYQQVYQQALADSGGALLQSLVEYEKAAKEKIEKGELSMAEAAFGLIEQTVAHLKDASPLVVLAMSPPYYPHVNNAMLPQKNAAVNALLKHLEDHAREALGCRFHVENYYFGISDLSYGLFESDQANTDFIKSNMLLWGDIYSIPLEDIRALSIPVLNIGPWGKDFHKYTERVNLKDLKHRIPSMVKATIEHLLNP
ncbi:MAG: M20/M25/M40 family metallo-hydrolase [Christensenellales bacterium]